MTYQKREQQEKLFWAREECETTLANLKTAIANINEQLENLRFKLSKFHVLLLEISWQDNRYDWIRELEDFLAWLMQEQKKCMPRGVCGQIMFVSSGRSGLLGKYPRFQDAWEAFQAFRDAWITLHERKED